MQITRVLFKRIELFFFRTLNIIKSLDVSYIYFLSRAFCGTLHSQISYKYIKVFTLLVVILIVHKWEKFTTKKYHKELKIKLRNELNKQLGYTA